MAGLLDGIGRLGGREGWDGEGLGDNGIFFLTM